MRQSDQSFILVGYFSHFDHLLFISVSVWSFKKIQKNEEHCNVFKHTKVHLISCFLNNYCNTRPIWMKLNSKLKKNSQHKFNGTKSKLRKVLMQLKKMRLKRPTQLLIQLWYQLFTWSSFITIPMISWS